MYDLFNVFGRKWLNLLYKDFKCEEILDVLSKTSVSCASEKSAEVSMLSS